MLKSDKDEAEKLIVGYADQRVEKSIEKAWNRARMLQRFSVNNKRAQLKKHILDLGDYSGDITVIDFLRYHSALVDAVREGVTIHKSVEDFSDEIEGLMYSLLGNIKLDRRSLALKDRD